MPIAQNIEAHQQRTVQRGTRGDVWIDAMKGILQVVPEEKFVTKNFFVSVKNGLPRHITQLDTLRGRRSGGSWHLPSIDKLSETLQPGKRLSHDCMRRI